MREIRCIKCNKKLAEVTLSSIEFAHVSSGISIKCSRCGKINSLSAIEHPVRGGLKPFMGGHQTSVKLTSLNAD